VKSSKYSLKVIRNRVRNLAQLSTLPHIAARVVDLVDNPKTSAATVGRVISTDQVLAARILKLANSAYYGFPREISTLNLAIVVLGFNALRDLVMSISVIDQFTVDDEGTFEANQFWRHALVVGMGARLLSRYKGYSVAGEVFVAGLLHDIGYLVMYQQFPELFREVYYQAKTGGVPFYQAEQQKLEFTHADLGAWLAEAWNLPDKLVDAIRYHHHPDNSEHSHSGLTQLIHIANMISYSIDEGSGLNHFENLEETLDEQLKTVVSRSYSLEFFQKKILDESEKIDDFLHILTSKKPATELV